MDARPEVPAEEEEENPRGTFFLVLMFLLLIIGLWFWTYGVLLDRGA